MMTPMQLKNLTPPIYSEESRDFQLLCNLYDSVVNGLIYDATTINQFLETDLCKNELLVHLACKLGFFTNKDINADELRYLLCGFPYVIKNKGSITAIKQALYLYIKTFGKSDELAVAYYPKETTLDDGTIVDAHTLVIIFYVFENAPDVTILDEIFKYILPCGVSYRILFRNKLNALDTQVEDEQKANLIFVSDSINSMLRGSDNTVLDTHIGAVASNDFISSDSVIDSQRFVGFLNELPTTANEYDTCVLNGIPKMYLSTWETINFIGFVNALPATVAKCSMAAIKDDAAIDYYLYNGSTWNKYEYGRYILQSLNIKED